jgi:hypothetical protein
MSAVILKFPPRGRFDVRVISEPEGGFLVLTHRRHAWVHGDFRSAICDAREIAKLDGVGVHASDWRNEQGSGLL